MNEAPRHEQLLACARWNQEESRRAFLASKSEKDKEQKDYLQRRSVRLSAQAAGLFTQADDAERDAFYEGV